MYSSVVSSKDEKENIKAWLKQIKKDRFWLAEQCGVHKRTVDSWFFKKSEIPAKALLTIYDLMSKEGETALDMDDFGVISIELDDDQYQIIKAAADRLGVDINTYCVEVINYCVSTEERRMNTVKTLKEMVKKQNQKDPLSSDE